MTSHSKTSIILCRHGETDWNREGRYQGRTDVPLNAKGLRQARELAARLQATEISAIYSSTLSRAYDTAVEIARLHQLRVHQDPRLDEINQGEWEGLRPAEIVVNHRELHDRWQHYPLDLRLPGGETLEEVRQRVADLLAEILAGHDGETVCVVAHSVSMAAVKHQLQGLPFPDALRSLPKNASSEAIEVSTRPD
ncbi:MAG: histidine phosphatase family protein [Chloroflexota bacterium]